MSDCEHTDLVYLYCLACELAKREKAFVDVNNHLQKMQVTNGSLTDEVDRLKANLSIVEISYLTASLDRDLWKSRCEKVNLINKHLDEALGKMTFKAERLAAMLEAEHKENSNGWIIHKKDNPECPVCEAFAALRENVVCIERVQVEALIRRLEAAERFREETLKALEQAKITMSFGMTGSNNAWRKAAGK